MVGYKLTTQYHGFQGFIDFPESSSTISSCAVRAALSPDELHIQPLGEHP